MLDPQAQALMQLMIEKAVPPVYTLSPTEARASYRSRRAFTQPDAPEVFKVEDKAISANGVSVPVRVYHPHAAQTQKALPGLVYLHGGAGPLVTSTRTTYCAEVYACKPRWWWCL